MSERLSVLVLTEDTGDDAHTTVSSVAKKLLLLLEPGLDERRLSFGRADERARAGMGFNCYASRSPRDYDKKVRLAQVIATHLLIDDLRTAVFVHIDGDRAWSARDPDDLCENVLQRAARPGLTCRSPPAARSLVRGDPRARRSPGPA